jgi:hypothetical protein
VRRVSGLIKGNFRDKAVHANVKGILLLLPSWLTASRIERINSRGPVHLASSTEKGTVKSDQGVVCGASSKGPRSKIHYTLHSCSGRWVEAGKFLSIGCLVDCLVIAGLPSVVSIVANQRLPWEGWIVTRFGGIAGDNIVEVGTLIISGF